MGKKKVLHIITDANIGGAGHQMLALLDNISQDFQAEVLLPENAHLAPLLESRGIKHEAVPHIAARSFSWAGIFALYRKIRELQPDIVHTHASFSGRIAARMYGRCKIVHTLHCAFPVTGWRRLPPVKLLTGMLNNFFSHRMIATSPVARDVLLALGASDKKIRTIFNGASPAKDYTEEEREKLREKYDIPQDSFVAAYISRLVDIKGHDHVLDAARHLQDGTLILFAGSGEYETHLRNRIRDEQISNVRLLGFVEAVDEILALMDVQVNASYVSETTSLSLLQGMSVGKPAVVTNFSGNPYVIEDGINGLLTPPKDGTAMGNAVARLKNDPKLYAELSEGARKRYSERFTAQHMARNTEKVYLEL